MRKELSSGMLYFHRSQLHYDFRMKSKNTILVLLLRQEDVKGGEYFKNSSLSL